MSELTNKQKKELAKLESEVNFYKSEKARLQQELESLVDQRNQLQERKGPTKRRSKRRRGLLGELTGFNMSSKQVKSGLDTARTTGRDLQLKLNSFLYMLDYAVMIFGAFEANGWKMPNLSGAMNSNITGGQPQLQMPSMDQIAEIAQKLRPMLEQEEGGE